MKKKNWILSGLAAFLIVAGSLAIGFSSRASSVQKQKADPAATCCQKTNQCTDKTGGSGEILLDNVSRQFMTIFAAGH